MDYIVIGIIFLILALAVIYIIKEKKKGTKCIGCPMSKTCAGKCTDEMPEFISTKSPYKK